MRPNVVLGILLLAILVAGGAVFLERRASAPTPAPVAVTTPAPHATAVSEPPPLPLPPPAPVSAAPAPVATPDEEIDRLQEWSRNDDPQSLSNILADLANTNQDVREAAIEAAKQFGSTNAIPALKAAAFNSTNPDEQIEMLQAAQFLALPSISDVQPTPEQIAATQAREAQVQAEEAQMHARSQAQGHGHNANGQPPSSAPQSPPQQ